MVPENIFVWSVLAMEVKFTNLKIGTYVLIFHFFSGLLHGTKGLTSFGSSWSGLVSLADSICCHRCFSFTCKGRWRRRWTVVVEKEVIEIYFVFGVSINEQILFLFYHTPAPFLAPWLSPMPYPFISAPISFDTKNFVLARYTIST